MEEKEARCERDIEREQKREKSDTNPSAKARLQQDEEPASEEFLFVHPHTHILVQLCIPCTRVSTILGLA